MDDCFNLFLKMYVFSKCLQYTSFNGYFLQRAYQKQGNQQSIFPGSLKFSAIFICKYKEFKSRKHRFLEKHLLKTNSP